MEGGSVLKRSSVVSHVLARLRRILLDFVEKGGFEAGIRKGKNRFFRERDGKLVNGLTFFS